MATKIQKATLVMSGKGGVGKSTVTTQLATSLAMQGIKVGVLDVDICGPSLARMFGVEDGEIIQTESGWQPVKVRPDLNLSLMSMAFLTSSKDSAVIWRGPKKHSMIERFLTSVNWGPLDHLIVDTPPGTSDEHISLVEILRRLDIPIKVVLVTTPQIIACNDVRREISFCKSTGLEITGLVENMSGFTCPDCQECTKIFSSQGGAALCQLANLNFLGSIPIDPNLCRYTEDGKDYISAFKESNTVILVNKITSQLL